jgi:hypothetical protein
MPKKFIQSAHPTACSISSAVVIPFPVWLRRRTDKFITSIVHPHIPTVRDRMRKEAHKRHVLAFLEEQMRKQTGEAQI